MFRALPRFLSSNSRPRACMTLMSVAATPRSDYYRGTGVEHAEKGPAYNFDECKPSDSPDDASGVAELEDPRRVPLLRRTACTAGGGRRRGPPPPRRRAAAGVVRHLRCLCAFSWPCWQIGLIRRRN